MSGGKTTSPLKGIQVFLLPLYVIIKPRETYRKLKSLVKESTPAVKAAANINAFIGFSILSMFIILVAGFFHSLYTLGSLNISGAIREMMDSIIAAFVYPLLAAILLGFLDTVLIMIPARLLDKDAPDYLGILLIRFSSLIGYALKPGYIAATQGPSEISFAAIYKLHIEGSLLNVSLIVTLITYVMTVYGLKNSGGLRTKTAAISAAVPIIAHILTS